MKKANILRSAAGVAMSALVAFSAVTAVSVSVSVAVPVAVQAAPPTAERAAARPPLEIRINGKAVEFDPPAKIENGAGGYGVIYVPMGGFYKAIGRETAETKGKVDYIPLYQTAKGLDGVDYLWYWEKNIVEITVTAAKPHASALPSATPAPSAATAQPTAKPAPQPTPTPAPVVYSDTNKPVLGDTPGRILYDPTDTDFYNWDNYVGSYRNGSIGQCVWYAKSRFAEVHGISTDLRFWGDIAGWLDAASKEADLAAITDINDIRPLSIAVFKPRGGVNNPGHVVFVEYVERDADGKPLFVYTTEANGGHGKRQGIFEYGVDAIVRVESFADFKGRMNELIGYIIPKK